MHQQSAVSPEMKREGDAYRKARGRKSKRDVSKAAPRPRLRETEAHVSVT